MKVFMLGWVFPPFISGGLRKHGLRLQNEFFKRDPNAQSKRHYDGKYN